jgi:hypothetical protein
MGKEKDPSTADRRPRTRRGALDRETIDSLSQLQMIKADLEKISLVLVSNEPKLSDPRRAEWEQQLDKVDLAISRARSALLNGLSAAFEKEVPGIEAATGKLANSLKNLTKVAEVINAVAGVLGVIEKVITLGR